MYDLALRPGTNHQRIGIVDVKQKLLAEVIGIQKELRKHET